METSFTPWLSLGGGMMIGASVVLLMANAGRIAGISSITSRLFAKDTEPDARWISGVFLLGLLLAAPLWALTFGGWPEQWVPSNPLRMAAAGLLVGFGAVGWRLGGFCPGPAMTALPIAATGTLIFVPFMLIGMWLARHAGGFPNLCGQGATQ